MKLFISHPSVAEVKSFEGNGKKDENLDFMSRMMAAQVK